MQDNQATPIQTSDNSIRTPTVSVCVVTYNQEKYIRKCLQSIIDQETNFQFDIVIADDCSTDGTREIIREFEKKYPEKIKPIFNKENIGPSSNFAKVHQTAEGCYIAHIDGDDYLLPGKLQAQADILDNEENCNIVWHHMLIEDQDGKINNTQSLQNTLSSLKFERKDILELMAIGAHSSKMYRKKFRDFPLPPFDLTDYFANVEQVGNGYARIITENAYGVYRVNIGVSSAGTKTRRILAKCFIYFAKKYPEHRAYINTAALTYLLADLKNLRPSWRIFIHAWIKTFHWKSPIYFIRDFKIIRSLSIK